MQTIWKKFVHSYKEITEMEWLASVINGKNAIPIIIIAVLLVVIIAILAKKGIVSLNVVGIK